MCEMMKQIMESSIFLACLLLTLTTGAQAKEKQIHLEDIERDNIAAERRAKQYQHQHQQLKNQYLPNSQSLPTITGTPTPPKMQYGFVPVKSPNTYQQNYQYVTPSHTQAYLPLPPQQSGHRHQYTPQIYQTSQPQVTETRKDPQEVYHHYHQASGTGINSPIQTQAYQQYLQHSNVQTQLQYIPEYHQPQIQYIVDNSIQQQPTPEQKYYQQQYVYIQPYQTSSASNNIQSVADTKGNVQYVMYIPAAAGAAYPTATVLAYPANQETQYVYQPQPVSVAETSKVHVPETKHPQVDYVDENEKTTAYPYLRPVFKHQPTSLLDSYVPSYLQYQYYKQQQKDTANAIKQSIKITSSGDVGKTDVVKSTYNYKNVDVAGSNFSRNNGIRYSEHQSSNY